MRVHRAAGKAGGGGDRTRPQGAGAGDGAAAAPARRRPQPRRGGRPGLRHLPCPCRAWTGAARHPRAAHEAGAPRMIGRISGVLLAKQPPLVLVDVQGVAYEVDVPMSTFYNLPATGERVTLHTHLVVREDGHFLFGFGSEAERAAFRRLLKISGVGARTALAVLSGMSVGDLRQAVAAQDGARLTRIPGIGRKTAERLLLELRDKLGDVVAVEPAAAPTSSTDILNALLALGYNEREAQSALKGLPAGLSVSDGIRQALKALSKA